MITYTDRFEIPVIFSIKPNFNIVNIYKNKNHIKMSITSGFRGKAAKKAHKLLDNKYDSLEKAILRVGFEGRAKVLATLQKQYQKEKLDLMAAIADGKIKEEDPAKKPATAAKKSVAKKAPVKKVAKRKPKGDADEAVDPLS